MSDDYGSGCIIFLFIIGALVGGFFMGLGVGIGIAHKEAVEANVAKYTVDEKTGETKFVFITQGEQK